MLGGFLCKKLTKLYTKNNKYIFNKGNTVIKLFRIQIYNRGHLNQEYERFKCLLMTIVTVRNVILCMPRLRLSLSTKRLSAENIEIKLLISFLCFLYTKIKRNRLLISTKKIYISGKMFLSHCMGVCT